VQRFGQSLTFLPDGRAVQIGGEHVDFYYPVFCIYNDVLTLLRPREAIWREEEIPEFIVDPCKTSQPYQIVWRRVGGVVRTLSFRASGLICFHAAERFLGLFVRVARETRISLVAYFSATALRLPGSALRTMSFTR
jgi:hypothetical protein